MSLDGSLRPALGDGAHDGAHDGGSRERPPRRGAVAVPALVAGLGLGASIPPSGLWVLAFPAAALLYRQLAARRVRARALAGFVAGIGLFAPGLFWSLSFNVAGGIVLIVAESCFLALAAAAVPPVRGRIAAFPAALTLAEAARGSWPFGGLPLGGVALGQAGGPFAFAARIGGPLLVTALVWLGGAALGEGWDVLGGDRLVRIGRLGSRAVRSRLGRRALVGAGGVLALFAAVAIAGALAPDGGRALRALRVAAVQGGGIRGLRAVNVDPSTVYDAQIAATRPLLAHHAGRAVSLVLWPEDVIALGGPLAGSSEASQMSRLALSLHATVLAGVTEPVGASRFRNEIVAWAPSGRVAGVYEKVHRVPFGEYVPFRSFFAHLANLSDVPRDAIPGHGSGLLHTPAGRLGAMVSYEVFFADRGRSATRAGATILVVPTNTSSYTTAQVPTQELAAARLQAIAEGRDLVQAAPTGFSALIDHNGTVLARSDLGIRQLLVGAVAERSGRTVYEEIGDVPLELLCVLALGAAWVLAWRRRVAAAPQIDDRPGRRALAPVRE